MKVDFSHDRSLVIFKPETAYESLACDKFPGLRKVNFDYTCPAILPIVYNLVHRLKRHIRGIQLAVQLAGWLKGEFRLKLIPSTFDYHTKPMDFQEIALRYMYTMDGGGLLLAPGMGKSKVVLDFIYLKNFKKTIVVCPKPLMFVWGDEIKTHRPELKGYCVNTTDWEVEKKGVLDPENSVIIINYDKAVRFKSELLSVGFDYIHLDEFLIKNYRTARTAAITTLGNNIPYRSGGSGTLVNNSPLDVFCPVRFLQPSLVGTGYYAFLDQYTVRKYIEDNRTGEKRKKVVAIKRQDEIRSILESCSIIMTKDKWLQNMPGKKFIDYQVQMGDDQREAYLQLCKNYRLEIEDEEVEIDNPLVLLSKLYQIANGFLYVNKETQKEAEFDFLPESLDSAVKPKKTKRKVIFFKDQAKITKLDQLMDNELAGRKFILWFNMDAERQLIETLLEKRGTKYLTIKGGEKGVGDKVRSFNQTQDIQVLLCQAKSVNYGITVLGKKLPDKEDIEEVDVEAVPNIDPRVWTQVFYSQNFSLEVFLQQQDRTHRIGQTMDCEYFRLFANCSVEERIKIALANKLHINRSMLVDVAENVLKKMEPISTT